MSILRVSHDKGSIVAWLGNHACKALHDFQIPTPAIPLIPDEDVSVVHPISSPASPKAGLQTFNFGAHPIRTVMVGVEPFWVAKDVAEALGYSWNGSARIEHVPEEWRGITSVVTPSGTQDMAVLSEQGLYFFLGRSDKAAALPMQKWVAGEVLPSIRKTGSYGVQQFKVPQTLCEALRLAADIESKRMELACKVELQAEELKTAEPAIKFHAQVGGTPDAISIGEFAKILGTGQNRFFAWLRDHGYIMKRQILPYQTWINQGIFIVKEIALEDTHGVDRVSPKTYITGRGQIHLQNVWTMLEGK
ncbi:MAG: phage antirepressor KilAC domain-containing protein [Bryobacteraceae bacterium]